MTIEVINQLRALRESIAETLRKDPRYLTLAALDKSIVEISGVLSAAGIIPPEPPSTAPLHFEAAPAAQPAAPAAPVVQAPPAAAAPTGFNMPPAPAAAPGAPSSTAAPAPTPEPVSTPAAAAHAPSEVSTAAAQTALVKKKKKSILEPLVATAGALAVAGIAAEIIHKERSGDAAKAPPKEAPPEEGDDGDEPSAAKHSPKTEEPDPDEAEDEADKAEDEDDKGSDADKRTEDKGDGEEDDKAESDKEDKDDNASSDEDKDKGDKDDKDHEEKDDDGKEPEAKGEEDDDKADENKDNENKADEPSEDEDKSGDQADDAVIPKGKASGYTPMQPKAGANQYQPAMSVKFGKLPNKVDLRPLMTPIEDQGDTSSCVANAVAGAYEYWIKKASKQDHNISRLFVYYNARWRDGSQDKDDGSVIQLAMDGLAKFGACNEKVWPFDPHLVLKKPGADAYQDAAPYKVHDMAQVPLKLESWKQALAEGKPIVFGCELFDSFDECSKRGGVVPMPAPDDIARKKHSGHSMCAVGYSDTEKVFIVRNSWGADWGDKGYCYMPYAYLMSPKFNDGDCWVFIPKVPSQPPREVWSDDTKPVTNGGDGVDFKIETYTVEDYAKVAVDLFETVRKPFNGVLLEDFSSYVSLAGKGLWSEMESFDFKTFLASTAALAGVAAIAAEFSSSNTSTSTSTSESLSSSETSLESSDDKESDEEQDADKESDDKEDSDDDSEDGDDDEDKDDDSEDGDEDEDKDDDSEDGDDDEDKDDDSEDGDEDKDDDSEDGDGDEDKDDDSEDGDDDEDKDDDSDDDEDDEDKDDDSEDGDDDEDKDDDSEDGDDDEDKDDDSEEDDGGDDDEGGDDDGGDDDGGGDDD